MVLILVSIIAKNLMPGTSCAFERSKDAFVDTPAIQQWHSNSGHSVGAGSSLEGQVNAPLGGISFDVKDMNRTLAVNCDDFDCVVEPGVTRNQLNDPIIRHVAPLESAAAAAPVCL